MTLGDSVLLNVLILAHFITSSSCLLNYKHMTLDITSMLNIIFLWTWHYEYSF
jgi:hypothetical protein